MLRRRPRYTLFPYTTLFRSNQQRQQVAKQTKAATDTLVLNEELTRILIDQQLQDAGWEADSQDITFQKGARPEKGTYRAIAEWPTNHNGEKGQSEEHTSELQSRPHLVCRLLLEKKK